MKSMRLGHFTTSPSSINAIARSGPGITESPPTPAAGPSAGDKEEEEEEEEEEEDDEEDDDEERPASKSLRAERTF